MYKALNPGAIGVKAATLERSLEAARLGGFEGVDVDPREIADRVDSQGEEEIQRLFSACGLQPAGWGIPVDWRGTEDRWREGLEGLPRLARAAARIGCTRASTWIMPCSNERAFDANWRFHVVRFRPIAEILEAAGCRLGLEFIGPKTLRDSQAYPFVHTLGGMLELSMAIGQNVGVLLDSWHWHTSHGTVEDLHALEPAQVVYVHVNDAPADLPTDLQIDGVRALPGETGVIDMGGFLNALRTIGYTGPVTPEPFKKELAALASDADRLRAVGEAMDRIFRLAAPGGGGAARAWK